MARPLHGRRSNLDGIYDGEGFERHFAAVAVPMTHIAYPEATIQKIVNYLVSRPYSEVFAILQEIQTLGMKMEPKGETMLDKL